MIEVAKDTEIEKLITTLTKAAYEQGRKEAMEDAAKVAALYGALPNLLDAIRSMK
jgi:hypothetical protein